MLVQEQPYTQNNMPLLRFDAHNPRIELEFVTDDLLRAEYPQQVMIAAHLCTGHLLFEKRRFCDILGLRLCRKIGSTRTDDVLYRVFAFAEPRHAQIFIDRFGGLRHVMGKAATAG